MSQQLAAREIVSGYRAIYKTGLRAVQYSKPARYILRDTLRTAFRSGSTEDYNRQEVQNTVQFLDLAAREHAMEHKIVKNILHTRYWNLYRHKEPKLLKGNDPLNAQIRLNLMNHFDSTIEMLNKSLGLCLR